MMRNLKLKVCGMRDPRNMMEVAGLSPDFMGFIFYRESPRFVGDLFQIPADFPASVKRTGVFVDEDAAQIRRIAERHKLDVIQLHGNESPALCEELKRDNIRIVKTFSVGAGFNFSETAKYTGIADYFLFDTRGKFAGGNSFSFDWMQLKNYDQSVPFFLSGGISAESLNEISGLTGMNLFALDINSKVEKSPAMKDVGMVREIKIKMNTNI